MKHRVLPWFLLFALAAAGTRLSADVAITAAAKGKMGGRDFSGTWTLRIADKRLRIETGPSGTGGTIHDLAQGLTIYLDATKRRAAERTVASRSAKVEQVYPRARTSVSLTERGATRQIGDTSCDDHDYSVRVPLTKDGDLALLMTGTACLARGSAGADAYEAYAQAAGDAGLILGGSSDNRILLALYRAQTELYRALAAAKGIPYYVEINTDLEGKGMVAGLVRRLVRGAYTMALTTITAAPQDAAYFTVPAGWKRERKPD